MKKFVKVSVLTVAGFALFAFTNILGDSNFEGIITFDIKVDSDNPQVAQMMQGSTVKTYIKGTKSRTETNMGMMKTVTLGDSKNPDGTVSLMDIMGNKYELKADDKTKKAADDAKPEIKYLDGTKTIAGYDCKEAQLTTKDKKTGNSYVMDIYYTDQLPYSNEDRFKGLKGFPLSFNMTQNGMKINFTATAITKQSVPDSLFVIPSGYKVMTPEEMQKDMMSHMGGGGGN
jgi:GLPGLI family protein